MKVRLSKLDIESLDVRDLLVEFFYGLDVVVVSRGQRPPLHCHPSAAVAAVGWTAL